jgi:hypothetical protein
MGTMSNTQLELDVVLGWTEPHVREAMYAELYKFRDGGEVSDELYDAVRRKVGR